MDNSERKVAVIAGHTSSDKGDWSDIIKGFEHIVWNEFIKDLLPSWIDTFEHVPGITYGKRQTAMAKLTKDYDLVIELHWNAFDPDGDGHDNATGVECLVWSGNAKMKKVGEFYTKRVSDTFKIRDRGCKSVTSGNGAGFLKATKGDALLLEPFFADNEHDMRKVTMDDYSDIILSTIDKYYEL